MYNKIKNCLNAMEFEIKECDSLIRDDGFNLGEGISVNLGKKSAYITYNSEEHEIWVYDMETKVVRYLIHDPYEYVMLYKLGAALERI